VDGADHGKIGACRQALMPGAGRQDRDIAGGNLEVTAGVAAKTHQCAAACDAEGFMHGRVIVQVAVDAVAPHVAPAVGAEQALDSLLRMGAVDIDRGLVEQKRQGIVGDKAIVVKEESERFEVSADNRHDHPPATGRQRRIRAHHFPDTRRNGGLASRLAQASLIDASG
jgi:hypothetical protein